MTPLHLVAYHDSSSTCATLLIKAGASLVSKDDEKENTPLHIAAEKDHFKTFKVRRKTGYFCSIDRRLQ
jgi:ankyrin repeat protein